MKNSTNSGSKRILFVTPYPTGTAGSQRFRFELFYPVLKEAGFTWKEKSFISSKTWKILYKEGHLLGKFFGTLAGYVRRFLLLFTLGRYDVLFIHREASPLGPPFFEWIAAKVLGKKIIYDFDDAIWKFDISNSNRMAAMLKQPGKVPKIMRWASRISSGNKYLADYARQFNGDVRIIPTVVDTDNHHHGMVDQRTGTVHIGWTGTHTTLRHLEPIVDVIRKLERSHNFNFYVICNSKPDWNLQSMVYIPWSKANEIEDLRQFHIGLMPLPDNEWANGKCGFKAIQYMSLGIAAIADPVGVNKDIIEDDVNGLLIDSGRSWEEAILQLLGNEEKRAQLGKAARSTIESRYSVKAHTDSFLSLFDDLQ